MINSIFIRLNDVLIIFDFMLFLRLMWYIIISKSCFLNTSMSKYKTLIRLKYTKNINRLNAFCNWLKTFNFELINVSTRIRWVYCCRDFFRWTYRVINVFFVVEIITFFEYNKISIDANIRFCSNTFLVVSKFAKKRNWK